MVDLYTLEPQSWVGLSEFPAACAWPASTPVLLSEVVPLKTGHGRLKINFIQPLHPGGGRTRSISANVVQRTSTHLTCLFEEGGVRRTAVLSRPDFAWLASCCPEMMRRRPVSGPLWIVNGEPLGAPTWQDHLEKTFGKTRDEVLGGTLASSFPVRQFKMPKQRTQVMVDRLFEPFESVLISRGCTPHQMEDKWLILRQNDRLLFRRSWTGILIYDVQVAWRGDSLYLGAAQVNRKASQYSETNDAYDLTLLRYLIDRLLRGVPADFPARQPGEDGALKAWSIAGSALLG